MNTIALLAEIEALIDEARRNVIEDLSAWHERGIACIRATYNDPSKEKRFADLTFYPWVGIIFAGDPGPTASEKADAIQSDIDDAVSQLTGAKKFLEFQLPDDGVTSTEKTKEVSSLSTRASERALIERLNGLIDKGIQGGIGDSAYDNLDTWHAEGLGCLREVYGRGIEEQTFGLISFRKSESRGVDSAVKQLIAARTSVELRQRRALGTSSSSGMIQLHPWLEEQRSKLEDGYVHDAVKGAATAIENRLREKMGSKRAKPGDLVGQGFTLQNSDTPGKRLRFVDIDEDDPDYKNAHEGAMHFGRGCFLAIRNITTHADEVDADEALDAFHALNLLARWIDRAVVDEPA